MRIKNLTPDFTIVNVNEDVKFLIQRRVRGFIMVL
jgi:hypothetical protein